jgi:hypothetical protein
MLTRIQTIQKLIDSLNSLSPQAQQEIQDKLAMTSSNAWCDLTHLDFENNIIDLVQDKYIWYREDELSNYGYILEDDRLNVDITEIIEHVQKNENNWCVIETHILEQLTNTNEQLEVLTTDSRELIEALYDDNILRKVK